MAFYTYEKINCKKPKRQEEDCMTETTFLSKIELSELVGSRQPAKQRRWLADHGYSFDVRLDGSNVVLRSHLQKKLGGQDYVAKTKVSSPNFRALEDLMQHA